MMDQKGLLFEPTTSAHQLSKLWSLLCI